MLKCCFRLEVPACATILGNPCACVRSAVSRSTRYDYTYGRRRRQGHMGQISGNGAAKERRACGFAQVAQDRNLRSEKMWRLSKVRGACRTVVPGARKNALGFACGCSSRMGALGCGNAARAGRARLRECGSRWARSTAYVRLARERAHRGDQKPSTPSAMASTVRAGPVSMM